MTSIMYVMVVLFASHAHELVTVSIDKNTIVFKTQHECNDSATQLQQLADNQKPSNLGRFLYICRPVLINVIHKDEE